MSNLLKMYKALEDVELGQRIRGAAVKYAHYLSGTDGTGSLVDFAHLVLDDPFRQWQDLQIQVVANGSVLESVILQPDGAVYTGGVKDQDIEYVVETTWPVVAEKYTPDTAPED